MMLLLLTAGAGTPPSTLVEPELAVGAPMTAPVEEEGRGGEVDVAILEPVVPANPAISAVERGPEIWTAPSRVIAAVRAVAGGPLGERVEAASHDFLGLPYLNDAAGEGSGVDMDPPSRYDAFDCLTFVEEILGLAMAGDPLYSPVIRDGFRYEGAVRYENRRHFMEAAWIPAAIRNGLVADITPQLGRSRVLTKRVDIDVWRGWRHRSVFKLPDELLPVGEWSMNYLDLAEAAEAAHRIPPGAIVLTLRASRDYVPVVVTHISLVVPPAKPGGEARMRHATRMGMRTVRDDRLSWYITHLRDYTRWPSLGITVLLPREQGPRRSALLAPVLPAPFPRADGPLPTFVPSPIAPFPAPESGE